MTRGARGLRVFRAVCLVVLFSATLTGCHELYCNFVEGLTGEPIDCSHDAFPDLGDIDLPPLPPPPSLPTTSTSTTSPSTTTTLPPDTTTTSSTTTSTSTSSTTSSTSTSVPVTTPGASSPAGELSSQAVTESIRAARERAARR